jgi:predicted RNA binding protein YcfA (HicA-like mRNA interferase family)
MGRLANISGKNAVKVFNKIGYHLDRQEGSHMILYYSKPGYPPLSIPNHKELAPGLLRAQIKQAGLSVEEFLKLLKGKK